MLAAHTRIIDVKPQNRIKSIQKAAARAEAEAAERERLAQKQLGHGSVTTTEKYVRRRKGDKAAPTR